jgi:hypothetical protein
MLQWISKRFRTSYAFVLLRNGKTQNSFGASYYKHVEWGRCIMHMSVSKLQNNIRATCQRIYTWTLVHEAWYRTNGHESSKLRKNLLFVLRWVFVNVFSKRPCYGQYASPEGYRRLGLKSWNIYFLKGRYSVCLSLTYATSKGKMLKLHCKYKRKETFKVNIRALKKRNCHKR